MPKKEAINGDETTYIQPTDHKQIACQFLELVIAGKIDNAFKKYVSSNGKHHNAYFREGFPVLREAMKENYLQFPNKQFSIKHVISEGDLIVIHSHIVLRQGEAGIAAIHLFRFQGNQIVEMWDIGEPIPADSPNQDGMF
jgi:predicted SnoaL-like aldol condensation-catalyzing enzyme